MSQQRAEPRDISLLDNLPLGLFVLDRDWRFTYLNPFAEHFFERVCGRARDQLLGKSFWDECAEVADSAFSKEYRQALDEQRTFELEVFYPALNRWFLFLASPSEECRSISLTDITSRVSLEKALHARVERLAAAERGKDEFLIHLAHEVRNALAAIHNSLYLLGEDRSELADRARGVCVREIEFLSGLMDQLRRVARLALGRVQPRSERFDTGRVVANAAQAAVASAEGRGRSFTVRLPPEPLFVQADPEHLQEALTHLLNNAAHFTPVGGQVWVAGERQADEIVLRVEDNGVGISPESLPHIFDFFMVSDRPVARTQGGLGTGLTLVRKLVELQGGTVVAHSDGPGQGSTFTIRLPAAAPQAAGPGEGSRPPASLRILVVENDSQAAESLAMLLGTWGYEVRVAYDGPTALDVAADWRPHAVLLDIGMPGMDGYEVARHLREQEGMEEAIIIAVTGYGEEEDRQRAKEVGFDYHMVKPVPPQDLKELLALAEARFSQSTPDASS
jgi:signal transduction histidine kinase/CheY-like chemotaxis protein